MIDSNPFVVIVIINWNGVADTLACLSSVYASQDSNLRVVVIDNNSMSDELSMIKQRFPEIIPIQSRKNLGFTGGCNLGIEYALHNGAQYIWLLNNDAIIFPNTLSSMIKKMQKDTKIGMISPIIYDHSGQHLLFCGASMDLGTLEKKALQTPEKYRDYQRASPDRICLWGTALLLRKELIEQVGVLDDRYFAYCEDTDYSIRAITHGWMNSIDTDAKILHGTKVLKRRIHFSYYMTRNEYLLISKHSTSNNKLKNIRLFMSNIIKRAANLKIERDVELSVTLLSGLWDALHNRYGEWNGQRKIPKILSNIILCHPYFISRIIKFGLS